MPKVSLPMLSVEDALSRIVAWLRNPDRDPNAVRRQPVASVLDLQKVLDRLGSEAMRAYQAAHPHEGMAVYRFETDASAGPFHIAAWELCRRGVLRPRVFRDTGNVNHARPPPFGWFFGVTPYGQKWLAAAGGDAVLPADYTRYAELLASHGARFGPGYLARSREAVRCYQTQTYLATCIMCGAAAESIQLALAIAQSGNETRVLQEYGAANGLAKVERFLLGQQSDEVRRTFATYTELLRYWRNNAAHGAPVAFDEEEAFTALILLLRFARYVYTHWVLLTTRIAGAPDAVVSTPDGS